MVDHSKGHRAGVLPWIAPALRHAESDAHNVWEDFSATYEPCLPVVVRDTLAQVPDPGVAEDLVADTL
jgi:hypothetical protein